MPAAQAPEAPPYDLTVLVLARPLPGAAQPTSALVALSYSQTIEHRRLRAAIEELMARVGGRAAEMLIEDALLEAPDSTQGGEAHLATAAQFQAPGLVPLSSGMLPVGAVIRSLPDWQHMRLIFVVGDQFVFLGPTGAVADGFAVHLVNRVEAYEYDVERMSERLAPPKGADQPGQRPPLLPAALIGAVTGLAAGWLLAGPLSRDST